jgi:hypothetical protein
MLDYIRTLIEEQPGGSFGGVVGKLSQIFSHKGMLCTENEGSIAIYGNVLIQ